MKALCYNGPKSVSYEGMPDAALEDDRDVLVKVLACSICGSDLHIFHGHGFSEDTGFCIGHEAVGEVVEVGSAVKRLHTGDHVMLSGVLGCGACPSCLAGDFVRCTGPGLQVYGLGKTLQGCQAEAVRVPAGDFNAARIPDGVTIEQALLLTDSLPTAWYGCRNADIKAGDTVVVIGLGPIGLMAVECAFVQGAARVIALDLVAERRAIAESLGAISFTPESARLGIEGLTLGRMADCVVEAVGADSTIQLAIKLAAKGGTVSVIGANSTRKFEFPMGVAMSKNLTFRIGLCSVPRYWPELIPLIQQSRLNPQRFITHSLKLSQGEEAYRIFDERQDGVLKVVMTP